jgi:DNA repair exonuclease SbcCD ATPase subunit
MTHLVTDLVVKDYQSLADAKLTLGRLTVVTGPTGSGKSSVIRALKLAAFNARGTSYVRRGATGCKVVVGCQDEGNGFVVSIERGGKKDAYHLATTAPPYGTADYTKLAGGVPEDVTALLRLTSLNFAGQFDRPFLLDETGSQVARTLGELTNVDLLFEAAREGERRRRSFMAMLKSAEQRLEVLQAGVEQYRDLPAKRRAGQAAEAAMARAAALDQRVSRLRMLRTQLEDAQQVRSSSQQAVIATTPPSLEYAEDIGKRLTQLRGLFALYDHAQAEAAQQQGIMEQARLHEKAGRTAYHDKLVKAGKCPVCGQGVDEGLGFATLLT